MTPGADVDALVKSRHTLGFKLGYWLGEGFDNYSRASMLGFIKPDSRGWKL